MLEEIAGAVMASVDGTSVLRSNALNDGGERPLCDLNEQVRFLLRPRVRMNANAMAGNRTRNDGFERTTIRVIEKDRTATVAAENDVVSRTCDVMVLWSCHP